MDKNITSGFPIFGLTFLVLLVLKLSEVASISWWWVFLPLMIGPILFLVILVITLVAAIGKEYVERD